jgi:hypothetical protein
MIEPSGSGLVFQFLCRCLHTADKTDPQTHTKLREISVNKFRNVSVSSWIGSLKQQRRNYKQAKEVRGPRSGPTSFGRRVSLRQAAYSCSATAFFTWFSVSFSDGEFPERSTTDGLLDLRRHNGDGRKPYPRAPGGS